MASAANAAESATAETDSGKEDAAAFQKRLSQFALTAAVNSLIDSHDTMRELEADEDE
jgi:hypothetical protein